MAGPALWGPLAFPYTQTEVDPIVRAEILIESARSEARVAILEILLALLFGLYFGFVGGAFRAVALFCLATVVPLLVDSAIRRAAAKRLEGTGPQPLRPH